MKLLEDYICHSGGCPGADMEWETQGRPYGIKTIAYSFRGHTQYGANQRILTDDELNEGLEQVQLSATQLRRPLNNQTAYVKKLLARNWFQVKNADAVYAIGMFTNSSEDTVDGGTGWAVDMAKRHNKDVYVFEQDLKEWYMYNRHIGRFYPTEFNHVNGLRNRKKKIPTLTQNFAGIGTRKLTDAGKRAIKEILEYNAKKLVT